MRYVDDFVILHESKKTLEDYKFSIDKFLKESLSIELHPQKSKIIELSRGVQFLGFRIFYYHKLLKKSNIRKFRQRFSELCKSYRSGLSYDTIYDFLEGWMAYSGKANAYKMKLKIKEATKKNFQNEVSEKQIRRCMKILRKWQKPTQTT